MEFKFPFTNLAFNKFFSFIEDDFILRFFKYFNTEWPGPISTKDELDDLASRLSNFENEALQITRNSNQLAIDKYFDHLNYIKDSIKKIDHQYLYDLINTMNQSNMSDFEKDIEEKEKEYIEREEVKTHAHLEEYTAYRPLYSLGGRTDNGHYKKINYKLYCIETSPEIADLIYLDNYFLFIDDAQEVLLNTLNDYLERYKSGQFKANLKSFYPKITVFVEGELDLLFINKAISLLNREDLLEKIELRQQNGYTNMNKIWDFFRDYSVDIIPQRKLFLYDCDTNKPKETLGLMHRTSIPKQQYNQIPKGIENLFSNVTLQKAITYKSDFIDIIHTSSTIRGIQTHTISANVNKDEKKNFCQWLCENGTVEDFQNFKIIFDIVDDFIAHETT